MDQMAPGADFLLLDPATAPARGLTDWLVDALRGAITDGRLGPGTRLPASRTLAAELVHAVGGNELVAVELRAALAELGKVVGAVYTDDLLDRIFSTFCIGK